MPMNDLRHEQVCYLTEQILEEFFRQRNGERLCLVSRRITRSAVYIENSLLEGFIRVQ
jgi:hypothetical protein